MPCPPGGLERRLQVAGVGPEPEVRAADRHGLIGRAGRVPAAVIAAVGGVDPVVDPPDEPVDVVLRVGDRKAGEEHLARVGDAVAVAVAQMDDIGRRGHQHAVAPRQDRGRVRQLVGEQRPGLVVAVEVGVDQPLDPAQRRRSGRPHRVAAHLNHVHPAVGVEGDADRIDDGRLAGGQLEAEIVRKLRRRDELVRIQRDGPVVPVHAARDCQGEGQQSVTKPRVASGPARRPDPSSPARRGHLSGAGNRDDPRGSAAAKNALSHHGITRPFQVPCATAGTNVSSPSGRKGSVRLCSALM